MEIIKLFSAIVLGFGMYVIAFLLSVAALTYGWGLTPISWTWVIIPAILTIISTVSIQLIIEAIKS